MLGRSDFFKLDAGDRLGELLAMLVAAKENVLREKKNPKCIHLIAYALLCAILRDSLVMRRPIRLNRK